MSLRDEILGMQDCGEKVITVPQWGKEVLVKAFTTADRYDLQEQCTTFANDEPDVDGKRLLALTVIGAAYDPKTGEKIFTAADIDAVLSKAYGAIELIARTANELSGIGKAQQEDAEKN